MKKENKTLFIAIISVTTGFFSLAELIKPDSSSIWAMVVFICFAICGAALMVCLENE